jgi:hypothetical protein
VLDPCRGLLRERLDLVVVNPNDKAEPELLEPTTRVGRPCGDDDAFTGRRPRPVDDDRDRPGFALGHSFS